MKSNDLNFIFSFDKIVSELERLETERISLKEPHSNNIMLSNNFYNLTSSASSSLSSSYQSVNCLIEDSKCSDKKKNLSEIDHNENSPSPPAFNESSQRSHDGVFLRPGAVSSSPPAVRFSKRPSIDSGINIDIRPSLQRAGKGLKDQRNR